MRIAEMQIEHIDIGQLRPDPANPVRDTCFTGSIPGLLSSRGAVPLLRLLRTGAAGRRCFSPKCRAGHACAATRSAQQISRNDARNATYGRSASMAVREGRRLRAAREPPLS